MIDLPRSATFRGPGDFYPTPAGAVWALVNLGVLPLDIWEPACGDGAMSHILERAGHRVVSTDLFDRGFGESGVDFLSQTRLRAPAIATNPPFNIADNFVAHMLDLQPDVGALLLRLKYLEGAKRAERIFARGGLAHVHVFKERVKFFSGEAERSAQPGWNTEAFAWFVWKKGWRASPSIGWISRDSSPQGLFS